MQNTEQKRQQKQEQTIKKREHGAARMRQQNKMQEIHNTEDSDDDSDEMNALIRIDKDRTREAAKDKRTEQGQIKTKTKNQKTTRKLTNQTILLSQTP